MVFGVCVLGGGGGGGGGGHKFSIFVSYQNDNSFVLMFFLFFSFVIRMTQFCDLEY